jgi:hypothetical protein
MTTGFEDAVTDMTSDLLAFAGESCVYVRGSTSSTLTLRRSQQRSQYLDTGNGVIVEVRPTDFIGLAASFPHEQPRAGDRIKCDGKWYEVQPSTGEKVFRQITPTMLRIHTKAI